MAATTMIIPRIWIRLLAMGAHRVRIAAWCILGISMGRRQSCLMVLCPMEQTIAQPAAPAAPATAAPAALARVELSGMLWLRTLDFGLWEVLLELPSGCYDVGHCRTERLILPPRGDAKFLCYVCSVSKALWVLSHSFWRTPLCW